MLAQQILGAIIISAPIVYLIYLHHKNNSIKDKFAIYNSNIDFSTNEKVKRKMYLVLECENLSNQVIRCFFNLAKSFAKIQPDNSHATLSPYQDNLFTIKQQVFPFSTKKLRYCYFYLNDVLKLAGDYNDTIILHLNIVLKYGRVKEKCNQEIVFSDKVPLNIFLKKDGVIEYKYNSTLKLLD